MAISVCVHGLLDFWVLCWSYHAFSDSVFEVTEKEHTTSGAEGNNADVGRFTICMSSVFALIFVHISYVEVIVSVDDN